MALLSGVYKARTIKGKLYFRSSITYCNKHISLGSYSSEIDAHKAYLLAKEILADANIWTLYNYPDPSILSHNKWIILINFRDNKIYFKNPIYLYKNYFLYFINEDISLKFDVDDLFYYSNHAIMRRGGYLFVSDHGVQTNILSRYGIKNFAVQGVDYIFVNGDHTDYRYSNIEVINPYYGVRKVNKKGKYLYEAKININGEYIIGRYNSELEAAIAYNKAINILSHKGFTKNYTSNYILDIDEIEYAKIYNGIRISKKILNLI